ncbi:hypothetical protein BS47DRAFT_1379511 [Hydnum rufescens UP504]|uniref:Uncharacterized protein n=1 Tax=Hydnum rufescens UP504 TaxID=1448309 RepID=A0A9P6B8A4_9AGAM|nr:hypothetical protein BS47DRAFT_1379511 [Hydnum rufescens UP504]
MPPSKMFTLHDGDPGDESWRSFAHSIPHSASPRPSTPSITLCSAESAVVQDLSHYTPGQDVSFNDIGERVSALHEDLRHLGSGIAKVISMQNQSDPRGVDAASMPLVLDDLSRVHQKLDALVQGETPLGVPSLHRKLDEMKDDLGGMDLRILSSLQVKLDDIKQIVASNPPSPLPNSEDQSLRGLDFFASEAIMEKLEEVHRMQALGNARPPANLDLSPVLLKLDELRSNHNQDTTSPALALVLKKLDELREESTVHTASNEAPRENKDAGAIQLAPDDLSDVRTKLDNDSPDEPSLGVPNESESNLLQQIFDVLNQEKDHQESQRTQQLESVRYLHELNQWLEQFVHQHTSQTQSLNQGVTRLLDGLGLSGTVVDDSDARRDIVSLLAEVHHTVLDLKQRESGHSALQNTVNMLIHKVNEDLERISAERKAMTSELMVSMFAQQREEQQLFVRALATDLTNQIRGERMQFVDAMKEVTSVNLKAQVLETTRILAGLSQTIREQQVP